MKIYLDIDGVLLFGGKATPYAGEFLQYVLNQYPNDTFWLTTRCAGDAEATVKQIAQYFDSETVKLLGMIKPTRWNMAKTDAIDFTSPFLWFDDNLLYGEKEILSAHDAQDNHIHVDLKNNPNQLKYFTQDFPLAV